MASLLAIGGFLVSKKRGGYMAKSRKEKRLARKQRAEEQTRSLQTSNEARFEKVYEIGRQIIEKNGLTVKVCHVIKPRKRATCIAI